MRARWFLVIGIIAGGLGALAWILARGRVQPAPQSPALVGTDLFKSVFSYVRSNAVDSLTDQDLYRRAAAGVIDELDDPYAVLLLPGREPPPPADVPAPQGLYLDRRDGSVVIVTTVPGSPAELAGVQSGDLLLGVDTIPVDDLRLDQAVRLLDGSLGSKVSLRLRRAGRRGLVTVEVIRGRLPRVASVDTASLPGAVGRLIIRGFPKGIEDSVRRAALALRDRGARSLVLDLRGAVGGDLAQGASVADLFLDAGVSIVQSRSRRSADSVDFRDSTASAFDSIPIAVLVDAGTAGAAEVVAGALQDHDRAAVLGAITFGRGVTQSTFPLGSGASLRLTTALWLTPRGRQIQRPPRRADGDTIPRPRLRSEGGRVLLGGGGIVPDRMVLSAGTGDSVLTLARSILVRGGTTRAVLALVTAH
ncbi:MAG TPA: S41 family peptidase [Gemmatimonadales bacterium]|jgi:carboxyl-terminal processing protease|nr:S41 family peptidase [Gemmatimonadales bacterium]